MLYKGTNEVIAKCRSCGDALLDGETAYKLNETYFCPECVDSALVVCRPDDYYEYDLLKSRRFPGKDD